MKLYIIEAVAILTLTSFAISCSDKGFIRELNDIESYINEYPDSAMTILDSISALGIKGLEAKAKFALIYSMAQDNNMMEETDDSIINIAVDWYSKHGTDEDRLKSYYYQGRVYQNAGDNEAAMESFVKADAIRSEDYLRKGLLYKSMAVSCFQVLDFPRAESYNDMAKNCYRLAGNTDKYAGAVLLSSDLHYIQEEYQEAIECLDSVKNMLNDISLPRRNEYYIRILRIKQDGQDNSGLSYELENYLSSFKKEDISWLDVADCYTCLGQYDLSSSALEQYRNNNSGYKRDPSYYISSYMLNDSLRNYKAALDDYINYSHLSDSLTLLIAEQDTEYIQEHYEKDLQIRKERDIRLMIVFLSISSIIILSCIIYIFRLRLRQSRKESEFLTAEISQYKENYDILSRERNELSRMIADNPPIDRGSMTVLNDRLELLNNFFTAAITSNSEIDIKACNKLKNLVENRKEFLYTTRMTFIAAHPKFIRHLESKGLTENEIEYCCLYVIGLKGKEIGEYINRASHYNESSDIRAKLGLGKHDTNLSNYLKNLLM